MLYCYPYRQGILTDFYRQIADKSSLVPLFADVPEGVTITSRKGEGERSYLFVINALPTDNYIQLPRARIDLLTGKTHQGTVALPPRGVTVLCED